MRTRAILSFSNRVSATLGSSKAPIIGFGLGLIAAIWIGILQLLATQHSALQRAIVQDSSNLALVLDQNIARSVEDFDRTLHSLQQAYERNSYDVDWPALLERELKPSDERVQIAIINASGMMITSSSMLRPPQPVDLSDREHFQFHLNSRSDVLFISRPLLGRASGKWSVQFTRSLYGPDRAFHGVIVVSLDPSHLARTYGGLQLGPDSGLAVVGADGIVRSGSGI